MAVVEARADGRRAQRVHRLALDGRAAAERDGRGEVPVDARGADGRDPGRAVHDGVPVGAVVPGRARDEDALPHGGEGPNGYHIGVVGRLGEPQRQRHHVDAVGDGLVHGGQHVGGRGLQRVSREHGLVHGHPGLRGDAGGRAVGVAEVARAADGGAGRRGRRVRAVAVVVPRRVVVVGRDRDAALLEALAERARPDELPVARGGPERLAGLARALPPRRDGAHAGVAEALALGPDARVDDPDDDAVAVLGRRPDARAATHQPEERRRVRGVQPAVRLRERGHVPVHALELLQLPRVEHRAKPVHDVRVRVQVNRRRRAGRQRRQHRAVPPLVLHERRRHLLRVHADDVRSTLTVRRRSRSGARQQQEADGPERRGGKHDRGRQRQPQLVR
uniref:Uncharacterized protein n=1 Tax=Zea mays TaxID=4577 RepID=A0A804MG30_MAIZE